MASWLKKKQTCKVIVHQITDMSIEGLLVAVFRDGVELRSATMLGTKPTPMAGDVWIPRDKIAFVQYDR